MAISIYFAGPDVFRPDLPDWIEIVQAACFRHGLTALLPADSKGTAEDIVASNLSMIDAADLVLANLKSFRGVEPDSGTVFEVGYALAKGKTIIGYNATGTVVEKVMALHGPVARGAEGGLWRQLDRDGWGVEDEGCPVNLMLAKTIKMVPGNVLDAIAVATEGNEYAKA